MKSFSLKIGLVICFFVIIWTIKVDAKATIPVFVSILPQKYFVEKIGGNLVEVSVMVKPGATPEIYEPKPYQMVALSRAKIYFTIGVPFEKALLKKILSPNPNILISHMEDGIKKMPMEAHYHLTIDERKNNHLETEKSKEQHYQGIEDPHIWLSPTLVMIQARNILEALLRVDPAHSSVYQSNYKNFITEIIELDIELLNIFSGKGEEKQFIVFHPAWGYFAHAYGIKQIPIEIEGKEPKPKELNYLIQHARKQDIKVVFVQPQFSTQTAKTIANAIGGEIVFANPLAYDWADNLRKVATKFRTSLK